MNYKDKPANPTMYESHRGVKQDRLNAREAIFGFTAFLTTLEEPITLGGTHECCRAADLAELYSNSQDLDKVRDDFSKRLRTMPKEA